MTNASHCFLLAKAGVSAKAVQANALGNAVQQIFPSSAKSLSTNETVSYRLKLSLPLA